MDVRRRLRVRGSVQGVGFRPFVYRHAVALGLAGFVGNDDAGVVIEVEGSAAAVDELRRIVAESPPPLSRVTSVEWEAALGPAGDTGPFRIEESAGSGAASVPVVVDTATCAACLAEMDDPADRRFRYPFTNCTDCGPRYTIVERVPYDRATTTMARFRMCAACQAEYDDPGNRRFHAQPNACPDCGPHVTWRDPAGAALAERDDALAAALSALAAGGIVAVKGLGGYHLAVDATDGGAVTELRRRKHRDEKPFAVMVATLEDAAATCLLDEAARAALCSVRRPIVLAARRTGSPVAEAVAPGLGEFGLVLPYTPLHHLLLRGAARPLVMTSGNLTDDPIAHDDADAVERLGPLCDGLLTHDRPIHIRCDDSVVRVRDGRRQTLRRSRGLAPERMALPAPARRPVLAGGAELKSTVAVAKDDWLAPSHHIGDLEHLAAYRAFLQATDHLTALYGVRPAVVAHDLHPEYLSTKWALDTDLEPWPVQHHHAHVASCLVEHGRTEPVIGIAFDGLGLGPDGTLWGGELLVADLTGYERAGHLRAVALPGAGAAIREPWRMALAWAHAAGGHDMAAGLAARLDPGTGAGAGAVLSLLEAPGASMRWTSSAGRLFDAVAAIVGLRGRVTYEGQAAVELEGLAARAPAATAPSFPVSISAKDGMLVVDPAPMVAALMGVRAAGAEPAALAAGFHRWMAEAAVEAAVAVAAQRGLDAVALTGGVFQNALLTAWVADGLRRAGLAVLLHDQVPPNDGGISVGQAAVAALADKPTP
ncbi:MAG TPA: carbamoyltransferase HypF [Acidimicrobiales bacterium]|nr:carbamoyltransferase HypF [Acidimicrobiales bacterium]